MPIALFYGADNHRTYSRAKDWLQEQGASGIARFPATAITERNGVLETAISRGRSLFGSVEGVIIESVGNPQARALDQIIPIVEAPVAIIAGDLDKKSALLKIMASHHTEQFNTPTARDMKQLCSEALHHTPPSKEVLELLVERLPQDSGYAIGTLRGLAAAAQHAPGGCTEALVRMMVPDEQTDGIFDVIDAMFDRDVDRVITLLARIDEPNGIRTLRLLGMNMEQAFCIRAAIDARENVAQAIRSLRPPIPYFRQQRFIQQVKARWNRKQIQQAQHMIWDTEALIKQGADDHAITSLHIIRMAQLRP